MTFIFSDSTTKFKHILLSLFRVKWRGGGAYPAPNFLITEKGLFIMVSPFANGVKVDSVELIIEELLSSSRVQFPFFLLVLVFFCMTLSSGTLGSS